MVAACDADEVPSRNPEKVEKIVSTLGVKIPPRDLKSKDSRQLLATIFSQWLPLATCTVQAVVDVVPPPSIAQGTCIPKMLHPDLHEATVEPTNALEKDLYQCNASSDAHVVAFVSKMFAVPTKDMPGNKKRPLTAEEMRMRGRQGATEPSPATPEAVPSSQPVDSSAPPDSEETILGFARLYSGILTVGSQVQCVLPKYQAALGTENARNAKHLTQATVTGLFIMMGRELVPAKSVTAGNVFAIAGLEGKVWRHATLCGRGHLGDDQESTKYIINLGGVSRQTKPIVRVALEPAEPGMSIIPIRLHPI